VSLYILETNIQDINFENSLDDGIKQYNILGHNYPEICARLSQLKLKNTSKVNINEEIYCIDSL